MEGNRQNTVATFFRRRVSTKQSEVESCEISENGDSQDQNSEEEREPFPKRKRVEPATSSDKSKGRKRKPATRKYDPAYLKYGFIEEPESRISPRPLCVVCSESFANSSMKPSKLSRHLQTSHPDLAEKPIEFFQRLREGMSKQKDAILQLKDVNKSLLIASYRTALRIAKCKKPFTIGEQLVKPCMLDNVDIILGKNASQKLKDIPMSSRTIKRRIEAMADDVESQVIKMIGASPFYSIQLDESTTFTKKAYLLCFVRVEQGDSFREELLCVLSLPGHTTGQATFEALDTYFSKHGISWKKCVGVCTDGANSMLGSRLGLAARIKKVSHPDMVTSHCMLHREQLAAKRMSSELHEVLSEVGSIVNEIQHKSLNSRLFEAVCFDMDAEYNRLLLHAEVRWLSRGRVLARFFALREEVEVFLKQQNLERLLKLVINVNWMSKVAYLADIFSHLNDLNLSLQGEREDVFSMRGKTDAFQEKLRFWLSEVVENRTSMFPLFDDYLKNSDVCVGVIRLIREHLEALGEAFVRYYPEREDPRRGNLWIVDPFNTTLEECQLTSAEKEKLIELKCDDALKLKFKSCVSRSDFWLSVRSEYPELSLKASQMLVRFSTTYLCEKTFSSLTVVSSRYRAKVEVEPALRLGVTNLNPSIVELVRKSQEQMSH